MTSLMRMVASGDVAHHVVPHPALGRAGGHLVMVGGDGDVPPETDHLVERQAGWVVLMTRYKGIDALEPPTEDPGPEPLGQHSRAGQDGRDIEVVVVRIDPVDLQVVDLAD